ncbi:protein TRIGALACTOSYLDIACYLGLYCEROL 4, chloroplastic-like [Zingiber officinale]|uniref:protein TRIGALACTOSYLDIACYLGLYCEROL 4, chloroplastic-like n=1 Tax=Zingiber officinale TaxID=94328 RepID=UPI001C4AB407|nr:protein TRIGALACTOSYLDIACYLGLYCEROL 4, chloroplastic-like [Zingiber officinale]
MMRRMRWAEDGGGTWELDMEAPVTMEGAARAVPGDPLPLGLSRGRRITRPKQLDFMHRFMSSPLVPSFSGYPTNGGQGLLFYHAYTSHLAENWCATILQQINVQKFLPFIKEISANHLKEIPWPKTICKHFAQIFSWGLGTEFLLTQDSSFLVEFYNVQKNTRGKAVFNQKLRGHNLTLETAWPGLFVDRSGTYWDVPLSMAIDFASVSSDSGLSYHFCLQHNSGKPKHFGGNETTRIPSSLLPGLCARAALSFKNNFFFWKKKDGKLKMVQPYDLLLSDPHISASGVIGTVASVSLGDCSARFSDEERLHLQASNAFRICAQRNNLAAFVDFFASLSTSAQYGNFQRPFLDLTRLNAQMHFPSGSSFLSGVAGLAQNLYNSQELNLEQLGAVCPELTLSLQQQIIGPFSFRVDSRILFTPSERNKVAQVEESVFAIDWALKVLGSAKATAWYSPRRQEAMVELRFFER